MHRCISVDGASEDLRGAGLRAANVFMARSGKATEFSVKYFLGSPSVEIGNGSHVRNARLDSAMETKGQWNGHAPPDLKL